MGNTASTVNSVMPAVAGARPRRPQPPSQSQALDEHLNEKFEAFTVQQNSRDGPRVAAGSHVSAARTHDLVTELLKDPKNRLALSALSANNPATILESPLTVVQDTQTFNLAIPHEGTPVTNQRSSGRCWIFAATNVFRIAIIKKYNLPSLELSQAYLFFWDKVEKANYFLESILATTDEDVDSRLLTALMASPVGDGGQWDMIVNLVSKYGLVPQTLYPDSWNAQNSRTMDSLVTTKLREDALRLRFAVAKGASPESLQKQKDAYLQDIVRILTLTLGPPPASDKKFTWEVYDRDHKLQTISTTPKDFAASLSDASTVRACAGTDVHSLFSLVNDPRNPYDTLLTVNRLGNVWGGRPITYVNVDMHVLKTAAVAMLRKGFPVFFGSDVGKFEDGVRGILDTALIDYELGFNVRLGLSKGQRLQTGESAMTHAMVLTAVHLDKDGRPVRWRIENSWSDSAGDKGYFVASDAWMDQFCYQAVVDPGVVPKSVTDVLDQEAKVLPLWDPMGALA